MTIDDVRATIIEQAREWDFRVTDDQSWIIPTGAPLEDAVEIVSDVLVTDMISRSLVMGGLHIATHGMWFDSARGRFAIWPSMTIARTAAIGAARALHIMSGPTRLARRVAALQILNIEAEGLMGMATDLRDRGETDAAAPLIQTAQANKVEVGDALEALGGKRGSRMTDLAMLSNAARYFGDNEARAREEIELHWRYSSGSAHASSYVWNSDLWTRPADQQLAAAWSLPMQLLEVAWDQWNIGLGRQP